MSKPSITIPSTPFSSTYLDSRHADTIQHIEQLRKEKEDRESSELSTRNYLSNHSKHIINKMLLNKPYQNNFSNFNNKGSYHNSLRIKSSRRVYDNFLHNFTPNPSFCNNIVKEQTNKREPNSIKERQKKSNQTIDYQDYTPSQQKFEKFYDLVVNKRDTFKNSIHANRIVKPLPQKLRKAKTSNKKDYKSGISYTQKFLHEKQRKEFEDLMRTTTKKSSLNTHINEQKEMISLEQKRKNDADKFYTFFKKNK